MNYWMASLWTIGMGKSGNCRELKRSRYYQNLVQVTGSLGVNHPVLQRVLPGKVDVCDGLRIGSDEDTVQDRSQ